jgi:glucose/arabinose dehydrogenase
VLTGIPKGSQGNIGRILFTANGNLYVGTGDAGQSRLAGSATSLVGKVLRVNSIGQPARGNPRTGSPVYTQGHRLVNGLCLDERTGRVFEVERGLAPGSDEVNALTAGADFGWPTQSAASTRPITVLPRVKSGAGDCAIMGGQLYVTTLDGNALLSAPLTPTGGLGGFTATLDGVYGRLLTVVAAPDGALWITTSNKDGHGHPIPDDDRVLRIVPSASGGAGSVL